MQRRITVQFTKLFRALLRKIWLFVLIMAVFIFGGICRTTATSNEGGAYIITGKLLVLQQGGESLGELMDSASRIQPVYDSVEVLTTGVFLQRVCEDLPFDMTVAELKNSLNVTQVISTRVVSVETSGDSAEKVQNIMLSFEENAQEYLTEIMPGVEVQILENAQTADVQNAQTSTNGLKAGVMMGIAGCVLVAFILILLYLLNDSVRSREEAEEYLDAPVIGEYKEHAR